MLLVRILHSQYCVCHTKVHQGTWCLVILLVMLKLISSFQCCQPHSLDMLRVSRVSREEGIGQRIEKHNYLGDSQRARSPQRKLTKFSHKGEFWEANITEQSNKIKIDTVVCWFQQQLMIDYLKREQFNKRVKVQVRLSWTEE